MSMLNHHQTPIYIYIHIYIIISSEQPTLLQNSPARNAGVLLKMKTSWHGWVTCAGAQCDWGIFRLAVSSCLSALFGISRPFFCYADLVNHLDWFKGTSSPETMVFPMKSMGLRFRWLIIQMHHICHLFVSF